MQVFFNKSITKINLLFLKLIVNDDTRHVFVQDGILAFNGKLMNGGGGRKAVNNNGLFYFFLNFYYF